MSARRRTHGLPARAIVAAVALAVVGIGCARPAVRDEPLAVPHGYGLTQAARLPAAVQRIADRGTLRVGVTVDRPGFGVRERGGRVVGFDAEMARLLAIRIFGSPDRVTFTAATPANREALLERGAVDLVIAAYEITPDRARRVSFVGPYFVGGQDVLVRTGDATVNDAADLDGRVVCGPPNAPSLGRIRLAAPGAVIRVAGSYATCADGVQAGAYDAVSTDNVTLAGLAARSHGALRLAGARFTAEPYGIGVAKQDAELRQFTQGALAEILTNGDWDRAWLRTLTDVLGHPPQRPVLVANPGS